MLSASLVNMREQIAGQATYFETGEDVSRYGEC